MQRKILLASVALSVVLGAAGFANAQSANDNDQTQHRRDQTTQQKPAPQNSGTSAQPSSTSAQQAPANPAPAQQSQTNQTPASSQSSQTQPSGNTQEQNAQRSAPAQNQPAAAQNTPSSPQQNNATAPQTNQPAAAQSNTPDAAPRNTAQQPAPANQNQPATAQRPTPNNQAATPPANNQAAARNGNQNNVRVSASLQTEQRTRLNSAVASINVKPESRVNFSVSVGTAVPRNVSLRPLPTSVVTVIPQYRGYSFFAVRDEIVIVEPRTQKIVDIVDRRGGPVRAQASTTTSSRPLNLTAQQKSVIRKGSVSRTTATTTGAAPRTQSVTIGEELPDTVVIEDVPETVYREVPAVRSYRYYNSGSNMYLIEPGSRRVIEEID